MISVQIFRWIGRLIFLSAMAALCASCVVNFPEAVDSSRKAIEDGLTQPDAEGQAALVRSWYGRLLLTIYETSNQGQVQLRKQISPDGAKRLEGLLQEVSNQLTLPENSKWKSHGIPETLHLSSSSAKIGIFVEPEDFNIDIVKPDCQKSEVRLSVQAIRKIVQTALTLGEVSELETLAEGFALEMFHIQATADQLSYPGPPLAALYGPPLSKFLTKKIERQLGAQGTVVWKAFAFIIGHEAHHIWSNRCVRDSDNVIQQTAEIEADILGTILSVTAYNRRCGRDLVALKEDVLAMLNKEQTEDAVSREVALQMALVPSPELLVGASGISKMQEALGPLIVSDPSHPPAAERLAIDRRGAKSLASRLYGQPLKNSLVASVIGRLVGVSKDELIEHAYQGVEFSPNYHLADGFLICTEIKFIARPERRRPF